MKRDYKILSFLFHSTNPYWFYFLFLAMLPHSGLDMFITGPLAGKRKDGAPSTLQIQHFHGIEGYSGWNSNDHPVIPFNVAVECGPRLHGAEAADAARIAGLYASVLNGLSTELKLPFGGYGLTAVSDLSKDYVWLFFSYSSPFLRPRILFFNLISIKRFATILLPLCSNVFMVRPPSIL